MRPWLNQIALLVIIALAVVLFRNFRQTSALRAQNAELTAQLNDLHALQQSNQRLSNLLVKAEQSTRTNQAFNELLKLRGELGGLRSEVASLSKRAAEKSSLAERDPQLAAALAKSKLEYAEDLYKRAATQVQAGILSNAEYIRSRAEYEIALAESSGDPAKVLDVKAQLAAWKLSEAEAKNAAGIITPLELEEARYERDMTLAALNGDQLSVLRLKLEAAEMRLKLSNARKEAGVEPELNVRRAQMERDLAAAEFAAANRTPSKTTQ